MLRALHKQGTVTIPGGTAVSNALYIPVAHAIAAVQTPFKWTAADIGLQISRDGGIVNFMDVLDPNRVSSATQLAAAPNFARVNGIPVGVAFEQVWSNDVGGAGYADLTTAAGNVATADVPFFPDTSAFTDADEFIVGMAAKFGHITVVLSTALTGAGVTLDVSFSTGANTWTSLTAANNLLDGTNALTQSGDISWTDPGATWIAGLVNAVSKFYIRIKLKANPTGVPVGSQVLNGTSAAFGLTSLPQHEVGIGTFVQFTSLNVVSDAAVNQGAASPADDRVLGIWVGRVD
jgi:hypothetical protein